MNSFNAAEHYTSDHSRVSEDCSMPQPPAHAPHPTEIVVHARSRALEIAFSDGRRFRWSFEFLRVWSPSAEVRGHGPGQEVLQTGKRDVTLMSVDPVGHYAIQPRFDDGHETGIYSWDYLYWLGENQDALWADYLARLEAAHASRDPAPASGGFSAVAIERNRG